MAPKPKRPPLTKKRQAWAAERSGVFRGRPLNVNRSAEARYSAKLGGMTARMVEEVERELRKLYNRPSAEKLFAQDERFSSVAAKLLNKLQGKFQDWFDDNALGMSDDMADSVDKSSQSMLRASLEDLTGGMTLKTGIMSAKVSEVVGASVAQNVGLIKNIPSSYFDQIKGAVMRSIQSGGHGTKEIFDEINSYGVVTKQRASQIARDQTSKATTAVNNARMQSLGIKKFEWMHTSRAKHPRQLHQSYDGQIFCLSEPPIIDEQTGERGLPGQLINCGCRMIPVITYGDEPDSDYGGENDDDQED